MTIKHPVLGRCPADGTIVESDDLIWFLDFPENSQAVLDLVTRRLNLRPCSLCKQSFRVVIPLFAVNSPTEEWLVLTNGEAHDALTRQLDEMGFKPEKLRYVAEYDEFLREVALWIETDLADAALLVLTGRISTIPAEERREILTTARLRFLHAASAGAIPVRIAFPSNIMKKLQEVAKTDDPAEAIRRVLSRQLDATVHILFDDFFTEAAQAEDLGLVWERLSTRLAPEVVTAPVLERLLSSARNFQASPESDAAFLAGYLAHMQNAIAHAIAGKPNPESKLWCAYVVAAWKRARTQANSDPAAILPAAADAPHFIDFEDLWDANRPFVMSDRSEAGFGAALEDTSAMMALLGFTDRFGRMMSSGIFRLQPAGDAADDEEAAKRFVEFLRKKLTDQLPFNESVEKSRDYRSFLTAHFTALAESARSAQILALADGVLGDALAARDFVAAYAIGCATTEILNKISRWHDAAAIVGRLTEIFQEEDVGRQLAAEGGELVVDFWNEVGNTFRYLHHYEPALQAYEISRGFLSLVKDDEARESCASILAVNEGRVFRQTGKYGLALERLAGRTATHPDDAEAHHGLAILYSEINRLEDAAKEIDLAIAATLRSQTHRYVGLLISRGVVAARRGLPDQALAAFEEAERVVPADARMARSQIAAAACLWLGNHPPAEDFLGRVEERLWAVLREGDTLLYATALLALGTLLLERKRERDLAELDAKFLTPQLTRPQAWPWELLFVKARMERAKGSAADAWRWFDAALDSVNDDVPAAEGLGLAVTWLVDKEGFQGELAALALELVEQGTLEAAELLRVHEFMTARSLGARFSSWRSREALESTLSAGLTRARARQGRDIAVVLFFEARGAVHPICVGTADRAVRLLGHGAVLGESLRAVAREVSTAMAYVNPAAPEQSDTSLRGWRALARALGETIAPHLPAGAEICLLPGRNTAALPLHLLELGGGETLIERHPVRYAPNLALLLHDGAGEVTAKHERLIVTVAKESDGAAFRARLAHAADALSTPMPSVYRLDGTDATIAAVVARLPECAEAYFLCHGTHGGRIKGYGICLSDGEFLPPPLLSIDDAPEFARFVLGWDDLENTRSTPPLVVAIACSSGRVVVAPGGARLGLEQSLFARGTQAIVSPLWDVGQEASLAWIAAFEAARAEATSLSDAVRAACLATKRRYGHFYHWGPFVLFGSLTGEAPCIKNC